jgi:azurin
MNDAQQIKANLYIEAIDKAAARIRLNTKGQSNEDAIQIQQALQDLCVLLVSTGTLAH